MQSGQFKAQKTFIKLIVRELLNIFVPEDFFKCEMLILKIQ